MLRYFHSARPQTSAAPSVLMLADAYFLLTVADDPRDRPGPGLASVLDSAISDFAAAKRTPEEGPRAAEHRVVLSEYASRLGVATGEGSDFERTLDDYARRRHALVAACNDDGWPQPRPPSP